MLGHFPSRGDENHFSDKIIFQAMGEPFKNNLIDFILQNEKKGGGFNHR